MLLLSTFFFIAHYHVFHLNNSQQSSLYYFKGYISIVHLLKKHFGNFKTLLSFQKCTAVNLKDEAVFPDSQNDFLKNDIFCLTAVVCCLQLTSKYRQQPPFSTGKHLLGHTHAFVIHPLSIWTPAFVFLPPLCSFHLLL